MGESQLGRVARLRVTEYVKSDDEVALQAYVDDLREGGDNVIGLVAARPGGTNSETGEPFPPVGEAGFWYACLRNGGAFTPVAEVQSISPLEGASVVGKWAGS